MRHSSLAKICALTCTLALAGVAKAQVEPTTKQPSADDPTARPHRLSIEFTTLRLMLAKGIITQAEFDSAMRDVVDTSGEQGGDSLTLVLGKWSTTMYGFVEADTIWDTTESFNDSAGNAQVAKGSTYAGQNARFTMGVRNTRLGFRMRSPEFHHVRASAMIEADFLGNQAQIGYVQAFQISEGAYFTNPTFRVRHANLKLETPVVDVLFGQYWQLFGWQSTFHPSTVEIQGVPGQLYARTPQLRVSKSIKTAPITFEIAVAMMRAPQRDSWSPEGQGGFRLAVNKWTGVMTNGAAGTSIQPLSIAFTADVRQFNLPPYSGNVKDPTVGQTGWGVAADAYVPLIPGKKGHKRNSLSIQGEYAYGYGIADLYTGLNAGAMSIQNTPTFTKGVPAGTPFNANADPSLILFTGDGQAHLINTQSYLVGLQYYFPVGDGRLFVAANFSHISSSSALLYQVGGPKGTAWDGKYWADGNIFFDATPAVRIGVEYAWFQDNFTDPKQGDTFAVNHRVQLSGFYIF
jgi:hypothetical protein